MKPKSWNKSKTCDRISKNAFSLQLSYIEQICCRFLRYGGKMDHVSSSPSSAVLELNISE